jgi:hypothetical protein
MPTIGIAGSVIREIFKGMAGEEDHIKKNG